MKVLQKKYSENKGWKVINGNSTDSFSLVLAFGSRTLLEKESIYSDLRKDFADAHIVMGSTSGEILGTYVTDETVVVTAIEFEKTRFEIQKINVIDYENSKKAGEALSAKLNPEELNHVFILSDGGLVSGTSLLDGLKTNLSESIVITGGLAGDAARFEKTLVGYNEQPKSGEIIAIGFYGDHLKVGYASSGGWDTFGPAREVTKSKANKLYELDGKSALALYKDYLGPRAEGLPGTALLFPLNIKIEGVEKPLVRTILSIDEDDDAMIFAGDIPEGATAQLMKANFDNLVDGAAEAATLSLADGIDFEPELAILISCVGRKLVLDQRIEEEVEEVVQVIGEKAKVTGFYSYGELAPFAGFQSCELHNQTMTITLMSEE